MGAADGKRLSLGDHRSVGVRHATATMVTISMTGSRRKWKWRAHETHRPQGTRRKKSVAAFENIGENTVRQVKEVEIIDAG
jgi:hypothetical protein